MPDRGCFVIMPFSSTPTCTEEEWTETFTTLFKPAVEEADLGYECRRSEAMRGNIVKSIVQDLNDAWVVIADLTDRNTNVFYELGVRHALRNRTIIVARRMDDIPFDLRNYAVHVYDPTTDQGRATFRDTVRTLLGHIDNHPERSDSPVSDFLGRQPAAETAGAGNAAAESLRLEREHVQRLLPAIKSAVEEVDQEFRQAHPRPAIPTAEVYGVAAAGVERLEPLMTRTESALLDAVTAEDLPIIERYIHLAGSLVSLSEVNPRLSQYRLVCGIPEVLGLRLLSLAGARAIAGSHWNVLRVLLQFPIEISDAGREPTFRAFPQRRDLLHPETFLANARHLAKYLSELWPRATHIARFFPSQEQFLRSLAQFYMLVCLSGVPVGETAERPPYPIYGWIPGGRESLRHLVARLESSRDVLAAIAVAFGESLEMFEERFPERSRKLNECDHEARFFGEGAFFPAELTIRQ